MKRVSLLVVIALLCSSFINKAVKTYNITDYGAVGDSRTINTKSIQSAIDACSAKGGGTVLVPKGIFISGAIFLKKGVSLSVAKSGVLKGSINQDDYPQIQTRWEGEERLWTSAFINAIDLEHISISGEGTIDGSGDAWTKRGRSASGQRLGRPRLICFQNCKDVSISDLTLHNQAVWCLHVLYCSKVLIKGLNISADHNIPSSDGMDIDSSDDVHITDCSIDVNDDCISIKSGKDEDGLRVNRPSTNILIDKCRFDYGHGGVAMGSETSGGINKVLVKDCVVDANNWAPIRFKTQPSRGGVVEDITYQDITLHGTKKAFEFNMAWRMVGAAKAPSQIPPVVRNIKLINIKGDVDAVGDMHGLATSPIRGVMFKDCAITAKTGFILEHVEDIDLAGLKLQVLNGESVIRKD
ncbi:glycoside hydrolase family 28 protein [Mucilaginibacter boryungensis]|uniref:Glycoside hydrolase family 28 protein n=1 Tax=Mucilaginibacter boryungensis TaxID=768480 RepID=A0ABR9XHC6_9SPHI|nr:glycoside hydrolase family 28 protein [Mucilaginibacter boryungensis]MBE9666403.1 glycoside hydrolase family 28 protein [Mucilaginibacter boryungensis]